MELAGKRVLLIGGAGLIGSHTVDRLIAGKVLNLGAATRYKPDEDREPNRVVQRYQQGHDADITLPGTRCDGCGHGQGRR